jgi:hypothetical protein
VPTATGVRDVPEPRRDVWQALAVLSPYCAVCDVSYVVHGRQPGRQGVGTTFVCVPGSLDGGEPGDGALRGEIVEWQSRKVVATRLDLAAETWTTRIELADTPDGGTRVTMTLGFQQRGGSRVAARIQGRARQRLVHRTLAAELEKVPAHIALAAGPH